MSIANCSFFYRYVIYSSNGFALLEKLLEIRGSHPLLPTLPLVVALAITRHVAAAVGKKKKMQSRMNVRNMAFLAVAGARKKSPNVHDHDWRAAS